MSNPAKPARLTRPQNERLQTIFRLIHEGGFPNCSVFAKELEVERRTVMRDLDYLRDRMHVPIEYDANRRGYHFSEPVDSMPLLEMQESDLLWLFVGQHLLQHAATGELADQIRGSFDRISALFGNKVSIRWNQLSALLSSKTSGLGAAEMRTFRAVSEGMARAVEIRFDYRKNPNIAPERRQVRPIHSALVNGQWYLFAQDTGKNAVRTFVFSRMDKVTVTDKTFDPAGLPAIPPLVESGFGVRYTQDKPVTVKLRVHPDIAHVIAERTWHPSQKIIWREDGGLILQLKVSA